MFCEKLDFLDLSLHFVQTTSFIFYLYVLMFQVIPIPANVQISESLNLLTPECSDFEIF